MVHEDPATGLASGARGPHADLCEYDRYFQIRVDGVFSDFPDTAVEARDAFLGD